MQRFGFRGTQPPALITTLLAVIAAASLGAALAQDKAPATGPSTGPSSRPTTQVVGLPPIPHWDDLPPIPRPFTGTTRPVPSYDNAVSIPSPTSLDEMHSLERQVEEVVQRVTPATVCLQIGQASGSGVIVSPDGWIITAGHVSDAGTDKNAAVPDQPVIIKLHNGRTIHGVTLGANRTADNGLVRITDPGPWPYAEMGESNKLKLGQWLIAIGHPGGYKAGRAPVVRLGRLTDVTTDTLHTDNTLVGGDSGGPLFDLSGKVVGIHSRISIDSVTENMHITVDSFVRDWARISNGDIWGRLGGGGGNDDPFHMGAGRAGVIGATFVNDKLGLKVDKITPGGNAEKAGLRVGDIVTAIDGKKRNFIEWNAILRNAKEDNQIVTFTLKRDGAEDQTLKIRISLPGPRAKHRVTSANG